jgi:ribosomal protein S18 acetylase RimI-like enzyme
MPGDPPVVSLRPMTQADYEAYVPLATEAYAIEVARNNRVSDEEGRARARRSFDTELPDGIHTPEHRLLIAEDADGEPVGNLWLARKAETDTLFIYDIEVVEARRGEGFGRRLMELVEAEGRAMGLSRVELNVHADNDVARSLYESVGYREMRRQMVKLLD